MPAPSALLRRSTTFDGTDRNPAQRKGGRPKGSTNKTTTLLKEAILEAANLAGGRDGLVGYLTQQAKQNPGPFMGLLAKVMPLQVTANVDGTITVVSGVPRSPHVTN